MVLRHSGKGTGARRKPAATADRERGILTRVNAEGWLALKLFALEHGVTLQALVVEALNDMLAKHGKRRVVKTPAGKS
jgi:hypothetical protein